MTTWQIKVLAELMDLCNKMGGQLDYTATHCNKLKDRQRCLMKAYIVIYGVFGDDPRNDQRSFDKEEAENALKEMKRVAAIIYPDRNG